ARGHRRWTERACLPPARACVRDPARRYRIELQTACARLRSEVAVDIEEYVCRISDVDVDRAARTRWHNRGVRDDLPVIGVERGHDRLTLGRRPSGQESEIPLRDDREVERVRRRAQLAPVVDVP